MKSCLGVLQHDGLCSDLYVFLCSRPLKSGLHSWYVSACADASPMRINVRATPSQTVLFHCFELRWQNSDKNNL